jgi:hypothetical protein
MCIQKLASQIEKGSNEYAAILSAIIDQIFRQKNEFSSSYTQQQLIFRPTLVVCVAMFAPDDANAGRLGEAGVRVGHQPSDHKCFIRDFGKNYLVARKKHLIPKDVCWPRSCCR